jgi:tryptophan synthase alpha chain
MKRIETAFKNKPIFMPYFPVGYPSLEASVDILEALARNGADLIEVGLSFSDPLADGPVIQKATQSALEKGVTVRKSLNAVGELRRRGVSVPLVIMGYYNPILAFGLEKFIAEARSAGVDGFIIPDLPPEEAQEFRSAAAYSSPGRSDLPLISMLAPTTPPERMELIIRKAQGFIYLVSVTGVTGARNELSNGLQGLIARVRKLSSIPVCVGFGIGTTEQARAVGAMADGVIVGSACVRSISESQSPIDAAGAFARSFHEALMPIQIHS